MNRHSLHVLEFEKVRDALVERAAFAGGIRAIGALAPRTDPAEVAHRLRSVSEVRRILEDSDLPIYGLPDLEATLVAVEPDGAVLAAAQIAPVARSLHTVQRIAAYLHERREALPVLADLSRGLDPLAELREEIDRRIDPGGEVRDDATPTLRRVRKDQEKVRERILAQLARIIRSITVPGSEPVVTLRNGRHVIGLRRDRMGDLRGVVHGQSGSGTSVYLEPTRVVPANNELAELKSAEEAEIRRILTELSGSIRASLAALATNERLLAELDVFHAAGRLSADLDAVPALPSEREGIVVRKGRHPILEMASRSSGQPTVPLDLALGGEVPRTLVITGPNTGGKTVALKTVGLFALMNQAGLHLPAGEGTRLPLFREIFADIGDEQSIEASLSTFSSHMAHVNEVLREAGADSLVLLDELGVGTDPEEGAALGKAILSHLTKVSALTIVTTHYGSLKEFAHDHDGMENGSLEFDRDSLSPTYRFLQGVPGSSEALSIAQRLGFPPHLVEEAREMLGGEKEAVERLLHDLQARRSELERLQAELDREREEARESKVRSENRMAGLRGQREKMQRQALEEARRLVERSKAELSEILGAVKADPKAAGRARTRLGEMSNDLQRSLAGASEPAAPARPAKPEEVRAGTPVFIAKMGWKGTALGEPAANGKVAVEVGSLRVDVPVSALELCEGGVAKRKRPAAPAVERSNGDARIEVDLRGRTVDEAIEEVDRTLDRLVVAGGTWVRIIHGKGTGALRAAISEHLENDGRVKDFRIGEPAEGGSGVTIAVLS